MPSHHAFEPFTFGIALLPRTSARDWRLVESLFQLTWTSLRAQTDPKFRVIVAGHERPCTLPDDPRVSFIAVDWPAEPPGPFNSDGGRKKDFLSDLVLGEGGGLFMALDADDWVDVRLVETARRCIAPNAAGGLIGAGFAVDFQHLCWSKLPFPGMPEIEFHHVCGSSTVARLHPNLADLLRRNAFRLLRSHHEWMETAAEHGADLVHLPLVGAYVVNTSENHSELHGPHVAWRKEFVDCLDRHGTKLDQDFLSHFGLELRLVRGSSQRFRGSCGKTYAVSKQASPAPCTVGDVGQMLTQHARVQSNHVLRVLREMARWQHPMQEKAEQRTHEHGGGHGKAGECW